MLSKKIVKYIQSLSHKKLRDAENRFIAEGPKIVAEFLTHGIFSCAILCAENTWLVDNKDLLEKNPPKDVYESDEISLQKISLLKTANRVVGVFEKKENAKPPSLANKLSLMLDDMQDPGNMGTIIRIADWFGIENIICSNNCVDCYNPKVVQSTMGSLARVNIYYTSLIPFINENKNISVYTAALEGTSISDLKNIFEGIIVIGNESKGVSEELLDMATNKITIPRYGNAESLNAAVAAGIILAALTPTPSQREEN